MADSLDFKTVVPAAQRGDKAAQDALMGRFYAWSVNKARAVVRDNEAAKNVAVDFWTWMFTEGGVLQYPADGSYPFLTWMGVKVRRLAGRVAQKRRPKIKYYADVPDLGEGSGDPTEQISALQDVQGIGDALPTDRHREVYGRLMEGATAEEIADELGVTPQRVRGLIKTIRVEIQKRRDG